MNFEHSVPHQSHVSELYLAMRYVAVSPVYGNSKCWPDMAAQCSNIFLPFV